MAAHMPQTLLHTGILKRRTTDKHTIITLLLKPLHIAKPLLVKLHVQLLILHVPSPAVRPSRLLFKRTQVVEKQPDIPTVHEQAAVSWPGLHVPLGMDGSSSLAIAREQVRGQTKDKERDGGVVSSGGQACETRGHFLGDPQLADDTWFRSFKEQRRRATLSKKPHDHTSTTLVALCIKAHRATGSITPAMRLHLSTSPSTTIRRQSVCCSAQIKEVTLLDYGAGNVRSVRNAIKKLGYTIKDVSNVGVSNACELVFIDLTLYRSISHPISWRPIASSSRV